MKTIVERDKENILIMINHFEKMLATGENWYLGVYYSKFGIERAIENLKSELKTYK